VLPKMHTPSSGLTIRSLSLYLSLCRQGEVQPEWVLAGGYPERPSMNLLVIPWPFDISPSQFTEVHGLKEELKNMPAEFGFFVFSQRPRSASNDVLTVVKSLFRKAKEEMGRIDGVVLPELSITENDHEKVSEFVLSEGAFLVAGVGEESRTASKHSKNLACLDIPFQKSILQRKHHRWKLDSSQIRQYGLGGRLDPQRQFWEHIDVSERRLVFASLQPSLVMTVLICEDLARPDPVGDLVRCVGPNLVIALLMDGPQLRARWPGRYAMSLADDPGSSVLSVTSLGMSKLSRPFDSSISRSRVVALWKDATSPTSTEIELPDKCEAIVLSLSTEHREEWTADGRSDNGGAGFPTLSGIRGIAC